MKFNQKSTVNKTVNEIWSVAYEPNDRDSLVMMVATMMFGEPRYYGDISKKLKSVFDRVANNDPEFILQLANYTRNEFYLRSTSIWLLANAANNNKCKPFVKRYSPLILKRADDMTEVVACYLDLFGKPFPNSLKKGINIAFKDFDEYQIGKYNRDGDVTFKDVIGICHPKSDLVDKIMQDKIKTPYKWETELSEKGNKKEVWEQLIDSGRLPYMAALRNLRNMIKSWASNLDKVCNLLTNKKMIKMAKQLPFRYLSAWEAVERVRNDGFEKDTYNVNNVKTALNQASIESINHLQKLEGKTIILCDNSWSARSDATCSSRISLKSVINMSDVGNLMWLMLWYSSDNTMFKVFWNKLITPTVTRDKTILENFNTVDESGETVWLETEQGVFTQLREMINNKTFAARIFVVSDLQIWDGKGIEYWLERFNTDNNVVNLVNEYRKKVNPNFMYYSICFSGHGNDVVMHGDKNVLISGWSDRTIKMVITYEQTKKGMTKQIKEYNNNLNN